MTIQNIITAKQVMYATIGGDNIEELNKEIAKINEGNGSVSPQEMREYLLREPSEEFEKAKLCEHEDEDEEFDMDNIEESDNVGIDLYEEYARQFGGLLITFMEKNPDLAKSNDWLAVANKEKICSDEMNEWLTVLSAKWAEGAARYALNKPYCISK